MPKTKEQKKEILKNLADKIERSKSIVFTRFNALGVKDNEDLRNNLKQENSEYYVAKKTLLALALKGKDMNDVPADSFDGRVAAVFGYGDEIAPAKIVDAFKSKHDDKIDFLGGVLENRYINAEEVTALAKLPSRDELYAKIVGSLNAPMSGFVNVMAGTMRGVLYALNAIKEKKEAV